MMDIIFNWVETTVTTVMATAADILSTIYTVQAALNVVQELLAPTSYLFPASCTPTNGSSWDFIIVGGGAAGSILASRLSENNGTNVLLIENGAHPPMESINPGMFPVLPLSTYDHNLTSTNNNYTAQNLIDSCVSLTQGNMLGGSTGNHHMIHVQGNAKDFDEWASITGDDVWNYTNVLPYFKKMEKLLDAGIQNSSSASYHGTTGPLMIAREQHLENVNLLSAFAELGHEMLDDISGPAKLGYCEPLFNIANGERQSNALAYLGPAKDRPNFCVALSTTATKILTSNGTATGVQMVDSSGNVLQVFASKEVIISAGAIKTPQLLMLSGIGPKEQLEKFDIDVVADLPVGQNFQDHLTSPLLYKLQSSSASTAASNPHVFPVPTTTGYVALNSSQTYPDYQTINLLFSASSSSLLMLCSNVFKFTNEICDKMYAASEGNTVLFVVHNLLKPKSRGQVYLTSSDYRVPPTVETGAYSNSSDLTLMGQCLADFDSVRNTTYFQSINASLVDLGLCSDATTTTEYWECYAIAMSATMWHYSGTAAMGYVLDSDLRVLGVNGLRVIDSSSMPTVSSGNINAVVGMVAEKGADFIKQTWGIA